MKAFLKWGALIAAVGFLVLATYFYSKRQRSIAHFTRRDLWQAVGIVLAILAIYRAASWLIADRRRDRNKQPSRTDVAPKVTESVPSPNATSFGSKLVKRPLLLAFVFVFFFSLPLLFRLSTVKANGLNFTSHDWFMVALGEALVGVVLVIGWVGAKRKYEKTQIHH